MDTGLVALFDAVEEIPSFETPVFVDVEPAAETAPVETERPRSPKAPEPHLGVGLLAIYWVGGMGFLGLTAVALDMLVQLSR